MTDNESAKVATDKGVLQGFCGVAVVDAAHQVIVEAAAYGSGSEQDALIDGAYADYRRCGLSLGSQSIGFSTAPY